MLVLSRKCGEAIQIGENIFLTILEVHGNRVVIGLKCPPSVPILRAELIRQNTGQKVTNAHPCKAS